MVGIKTLLSQEAPHSKQSASNFLTYSDIMIAQVSSQKQPRSMHCSASRHKAMCCNCTRHGS